jgi:SRSO17 transposase
MPFMAFEMDSDACARLNEYFERRIGRHLQRPEQRASFAHYAFGLMSNAERKSVEPIAACATGDPEQCQGMHNRLLHFLGRGTWSDEPVRLEAARYVIEAAGERGEKVGAWIIDDTGFLKQGTHSVGVKRQYTGSAGKIANCQVAVSLTIATGTEHVPIDFELYMPKEWVEDPKRMKKVRCPESLKFKTKPDLALDMIGRACAAGIPGDVVLADSGYGDSCEFRNTVRMFGLDYAVGIKSGTKVWLLDSRGRRRGDPIAVRDLGIKLGRSAFRRKTWKEGTRSKLSSHFAFRRVKVAHDDGTEAPDREQVWLVMEWLDGETTPTKFTLTTLPRRMSKKAIVRTLKERWRTERAYEELKGELGLDHFEGRTFPGWHHHVSVVLSCYAFLVGERMRRFSPSAGRACSTAAVRLAA